MFKFGSSIRQKIIFGYYGTVAIIIGLSIFAFTELRYLEDKIRFGEVISEFFDTTLEIRRFEKNYFLYRQWNDYQENMRYVMRASELLESNVKGFDAIAKSEQIADMREDLKQYKELMESYGRLKDQSAAQRVVTEGKIRENGKDIITEAEDISKTERRNLGLLLARSRRILIVSIFLLALFAIAIGRVLSRIVVKPLKSLEDNMRIIAEGRFETVSINSKDREIASLTKALNTMLKELELRQRHLIQSEKLASLGTLLSGVAHELNNPLSNISSSCQILMEEIRDADIEYKKELLAQIEEQTDRARNTVRSLLEFSRDKDFKKESVNLMRLIEETIRFIKGQIPARVEMRIDIPEDIMISADKQRIQQAFLNLIKNAVESIVDEGVISVFARKHFIADRAVDYTAGIYNYLRYKGKCEIEGAAVDITVSDTGSGIPGEILSKIFDPFFTTKDVGKGSGLGLFIVHEIIEEHDGCIAVDSEVGKGTKFLIRLPLKEY